MLGSITARTSSRANLSDRGHRQESMSRLLRGALHDLDITQDELASACGVKQSKVSAWLDHRRPEAPALHDVLAMPLALAQILLRELVRAHGMSLSPLPENTRRAGNDDLTILVAATKEHGEAIAAAASCLRPNHTPTRVQLLELEREATESIEATVGLRDVAAERLEQMATDAIRASAPSKPRSSSVASRVDRAVEVGRIVMRSQPRGR